MKHLDIVGVLNSGKANAIDIYTKYVKEGLDLSLNLIVPINDDLSGKHIQTLTNKQISDKGIYHYTKSYASKLHPELISESIHSKDMPHSKIVTIEKNPEYRFFGTPQTSGIVLVVDDFLYSGKTMTNVVMDIYNLGYLQNNIFYYCEQYDDPKRKGVYQVPIQDYKERAENFFRANKNLIVLQSDYHINMLSPIKEANIGTSDFIRFLKE